MRLLEAYLTYEHLSSNQAVQGDSNDKLDDTNFITGAVDSVGIELTLVLRLCYGLDNVIVVGRGTSW